MCADGNAVPTGNCGPDEPPPSSDPIVIDDPDGEDDGSDNEEDLTFRLTMFIPIDHVKMPSGLIFWLGDEIFTGDNRTFAGNGKNYWDHIEGESEPEIGDGLTYRIAQEFTIRPTQGLLRDTEKKISGLTERFDLHTSMTSEIGGSPADCYRKKCSKCSNYNPLHTLGGFEPMHIENSCIATVARDDDVLEGFWDELAFDGVMKEARKVASISSLMVQEVSYTSEKLTLLIKGDPSNSIVPNTFGTALSITWQMYVEFYFIGDKVTRWKVYGAGEDFAAHDGFPAYEIEINKRSVYQWDPIDKGKNPGNLNTVLADQISLDIEGTP